MKIVGANVAIKRMQEERKILMDKIKFLREVKSIDFNCPIDWSYGAKQITCHIYKYEDLHKTRTALREAFGSWNDELIRVMPWKNGEGKQKVEYLWRGGIPTFPNIPAVIMLDIDYDTMPEELKNLHEGCVFEYKIEKTEAKEEVVLHYICKKE